MAKPTPFGSPRRVVRIVTPQSDPLAELPAAEVMAYLDARELTYRRSGMAGEIVAFGRPLDAAVREVDGKAFRWIRGRDSVEWDLVAEVLCHLREHGRAVYVPARRLMRHYYSTRGFVMKMEDVAGAVADAEVYIPAGSYGAHWIFGLRRTSVRPDASS